MLPVSWQLHAQLTDALISSLFYFTYASRYNPTECIFKKEALSKTYLEGLEGSNPIFFTGRLER